MRHLLPIVTAVLIFSACKTVQYVPYKVTETIRITDTTVLHHIDTLVKVPEFHISDIASLQDTLRLEASVATATAWVDTASLSLKGRLDQNGSLPFKVLWKERIVYRDSVAYQEKPVPYEVVKRERYVPWIYRVFAVLGIVALAVAVFWILRRFKVL